MSYKFKIIAIITLIAFIKMEHLSAQHIDSIIERSLNALGGRQSFNDLNSVYKEGIYFEDGDEANAIEEVKKDGEFYTVKEYYIPFQGKKITNFKNKDTIESSTIFNLEDAWEFSESKIQPEGNKLLEISPVPKYKFYTIFYGSKKYAFNTDLPINNYSDDKNTVYDGFELRGNVRCIKLLLNKINNLYLNANTYLPYLYIERFMDLKLKKEILVEYTYEDYRLTNVGLIMPYRIKQNTVGITIPTIFKYNTIELNKLAGADVILNTKAVAKEFKARNKQKRSKKTKPTTTTAP